MGRVPAVGLARKCACFSAPPFSFCFCSPLPPPVLHCFFGATDQAKINLPAFSCECWVPIQALSVPSAPQWWKHVNQNPRKQPFTVEGKQKFLIKNGVRLNTSTQTQRQSACGHICHSPAPACSKEKTFCFTSFPTAVMVTSGTGSTAS